jgi:hypothetical protein
MTLAISTVIASIADVTVAGLTICDLTDIPASALRRTPILLPMPGQEVTEFTATRESFGAGSSALVDCDYDLNYYLLYCEAGAGRTGLDYEKERIEMVQAIWDAVIAIDTLSGAVDIWPKGGVNFVTLEDPSGNQFLGSQLVFHVKEFWR